MTGAHPTQGHWLHAAVTAPTPDPARTIVRTGPDRWHLRSVSILVVLLLLTQRIGVPFGGVVTSVAVPLAYLFLAVGLARARIVVSWVRAGLLVVALSACLLSTAAVSWLGKGAAMSLFSLVFLVVLYIPWAFRTPEPHGDVVVARAGRTFVWTMTVLAVVGMAQVAAQLTGVWTWDDYLADLVPRAYMIPSYNFNNELAYGVGVYKATSFVMLEPSFLSQFCALAILVGIMLRISAWQVLVLAGGMASAVSGTGIILLAAGGVLLVLRAPHRLRPIYLLIAAVGPVVVLKSPLGTFLLQRQGELSTGGTSGNARFVAPYEAAWRGLLDDPTRFLVGGGPGSVERLIPGARISPRATDVLYSVVPKLAFEYGVVAGGLFALFLVVAIIDRAPWRVVPTALVVMVFLLSGALLQPQTAYLVWLLAGIGARPSARGEPFSAAAGADPARRFDKVG